MPGMQSHANHVGCMSDFCSLCANSLWYQIRLNRRKSARHFKAIFWVVISEFEPRVGGFKPTNARLRALIDGFQRPADPENVGIQFVSLRQRLICSARTPG
jgi:deoxyribodipyrimidine photolyase-like uncharacterized protein